MKFIDKEHQMEIRENWLSERGRVSKDVLFDDVGEYIITDSEEGEMEDGRMTTFSEAKKVYLPEQLDSAYIPFDEFDEELIEAKRLTQHND